MTAAEKLRALAENLRAPWDGARVDADRFMAALVAIGRPSVIGEIADLLEHAASQNAPGTRWSQDYAKLADMLPDVTSRKDDGA